VAGKPYRRGRGGAQRILSWILRKGWVSRYASGQQLRRKISLFMQRKMFWLIFAVLGLIADFALPLVWGLIATIPLLFLSWWIAFRSGWFE
jgi:hypothetical protein